MLLQQLKIPGCPHQKNVHRSSLKAASCEAATSGGHSYNYGSEGGSQVKKYLSATIPKKVTALDGLSDQPRTGCSSQTSLFMSSVKAIVNGELF